MNRQKTGNKQQKQNQKEFNSKKIRDKGYLRTRPPLK